MYTSKLVSSFKERLALLCEMSSLTDGEMAKKLEVSKQTLSAWRCGTRSPKPPTIATIARYFNVSVDWLMGFDVPQTKEELATQTDDELDKTLNNLLSQLPPKKLEALLSLSPADLDKLLDYAEFLAARGST